MKIRILIFISVLFISLYSKSQDNLVWIHGVVKETHTKNILEGVSVLYADQSGVLTDAAGKFGFYSDTGDLTITFRYLGYNQQKKTFRIPSLDTFHIEVFLSPAIEELEEVVVSASKTEEKISNLTVSMTTLSADRLAKNHTIHAEDIIQKIPGVEILDGQASIRGGSGYSYGAGSRVLVLVDGLPVLATDAGNVKWHFLPLESVSKIEILKGASSVLYGSSALNGVINFRTTKTTEEPFTKVIVQSGIYDSPKNKAWKWWDSPRTFNSVSFFHAGKLAANDFGVGLTLHDDEGYRKDNIKKMARFNAKWNRNSKQIEGLQFGVNLNTMLTKRIDFILWQDGETGALIQKPETVLELKGFGFALDPYISYSPNTKITHEFQSRFQSTNNRYPEDSKNNNSDAYSYYSEYRFGYNPLKKVGLNMGISEMHSSIISNFYGNHDGMNIALYSQLSYQPVEGLNTVAGIRLEQYALDGNSDKIKPIFRTGINYQVLKYTFLRASFGQGYRYPSIAEKHAYTTVGAVRIYPNPEIVPESGWSAELGIKQGLSFAGCKGQVDMAAFYSENTDLIQYEFGLYDLPDSQVTNFGFMALNIENSRVYGFELEMSLVKSVGEFIMGMEGGYTYIYPIEFNPISSQNTEEYLKYRNKNTLKALIFVGYKKWDGQISGIYKSKMLNIDDVFLHPLTREQFLPGFYEYWTVNNNGYLVMDFEIGYSITRTSSISLDIKNFLNEEYMGRPGDIQPPRSYSLQYKLLLL
ncbi:MAG: TonB-dependent receptor [Bacteroidales bacterium]|nr:TonB-dependent receptor [Bacteroidales bacterium]